MEQKKFIASSKSENKTEKNDIDALFFVSEFEKIYPKKCLSIIHDIKKFLASHNRVQNCHVQYTFLDRHKHERL
jgi:hypothetical protein